VPVADPCNPSYSRSRDQQDHGSKPAQQNSKIVHKTLFQNKPSTAKTKKKADLKLATILLSVGGWYVSPCLAKSLCFFIAKQYIP
jgi:hypothetical protein